MKSVTDQLLPCCGGSHQRQLGALAGGEVLVELLKLVRDLLDPPTPRHVWSDRSTERREVVAHIAVGELVELLAAPARLRLQVLRNVSHFNDDSFFVGSCSMVLREIALAN
jgi:hypothetical protein